MRARRRTGLFGGEVAVAEDGEVVGDVAGNDEGEGADGESVAAGDAGAEPCVGREIFEKRDGRKADFAEFVDVRGPGNFVGCSACGGGALVEAGKGFGEASGEPKSAESEGAFGVGDVAEDFADGPFFRGVAAEGFFFGDGGERLEGVGELGFDDDRGIHAGDLIDVGEVVGSGFGGLRASDHLGSVLN